MTDKNNSSMQVRIWLQASRFPSQAYILLPLLLGVALGGWGGSAMQMLVLFAYGLSLQLFIVFANDVADYETDRINKTATFFSGGSKVLRHGLLTRRHLLRAAGWMLFSLLLASLLLAVWLGKWIFLPLALFSILLLHAYSFAPFQLSYRGGGEFLQAIGMGTVLPVFGFCIAKDFELFPWKIMLVLIPMQVACAYATTLPDEPSDRFSGKKTISVLLGGHRVSWVIACLQIFAVCCYGLIYGYQGPFSMILWVGWLLMLGLMLYFRKAACGSFYKTIQALAAVVGAQFIFLQMFFVV